MGDKIVNALQLPIPEDDPAIAIIGSILTLAIGAGFFSLLYWLGWLLPFGESHTWARAAAMAEYVVTVITSFTIVLGWVKLQEL